MARRKDMLTEKKNPLSLGVYKALGAFFIALLESRWESEIHIYDVFFSAISINKNKDGEGSDRTWRRWKSLNKGNHPFLGDRPELVLDAVEWARTYKNNNQTLISDSEALQLSESFRTLLNWDEISKDVNEGFQDRVHGIIDTAFELAEFELNEKPAGYKDKITGEVFEYLSPNGYSSSNEVGYKHIDGERSKEELFLRTCAFDLIKKSENLAAETLADDEASEQTFVVINHKDKLKSLSYANKKEVLRQLLLEGESLADKAFALGGESALKVLLKAIKVKYIGYSRLH